MPDLKDRMLPWRNKDGWGIDRTEKLVRVATLENDILRVDVTPQWGGRVHRAIDKRTQRHLVYFNPEHQSVNDGVLRSCELSGIEWNWSPGQIGHTVFSENPVYVAKLSTAHGDALRIWEHDRWNGTVWQVDLHLRGASLWAHVRIINPTPAPLKGYWWTNVQMPKTSGTSHTPEFINGQRCKPSDPTWPGSRVISPAWGTVTYTSHGLGLVDWPRFNQNCCGFGQSTVPGSMDGRGGGSIDMSWLSNYTGDNDAFLMCVGWNQTAVPFIVLADKDLWGDQHGVLHGHGTPFNKIWTMGMDDTHAWSETTHNWGGCFVELQIGVAPTQSHTFPLPAHTSHHHSEYWQLLDGLSDADRLYHPDYHVAVSAVSEYVNGAKGVPPEVRVPKWCLTKGSSKKVFYK